MGNRCNDFAFARIGKGIVMAKTIKELASSYAFDNTSTEAEFFLVDNAYKEAAYAILDKIEGILPKNDKSLNDAGKALVWRLRDKIKELEGI